MTQKTKTNSCSYLIKRDDKDSIKNKTLVFDYLFHKQCLKSMKHGQVCRRDDYAIIPLQDDATGRQWEFVSLSMKNKVLINPVFDIEEMTNISQKALFIINALKTRAVVKNIISDKAFSI